MATSSQKSKQTLPDGTGKRIAVVASRFNEDLCQALLDGAVDALKKSGVAEEAISIFRVAGAFELPLTLQSLANTELFDGAVALGVIIRGETAHFEYVAGETSRGVMDVMLKTGLPVGFGLLTTENEQQAKDRAGGPWGNKGEEAAWVALEMVQQLAVIEALR